MPVPPSPRPRLLDLFCRAGGAGTGYHRAGFDVTGVDLEPMHGVYPFTFIQGDAIEYVREHGHEYDAIHASPPCQDVIAITAGNRARPGWSDQHVNLVPPTRKALSAVRAATGVPTVIECGVGRHLRRDLRLCGEMFDLAVIRHRWFEIHGAHVPEPPHPPHRGRVAGMRHGAWFEGPYFAVYGEGGGKGTVAQWQQAMGIDWTEDRRNLAEAIPPAYTALIAAALLPTLTPARSDLAMPARAPLYVVPDDPDPTTGPTERAMPVDLDAEQAVLGAAMLSRDALAEMRTLIDGTDFYKPAHETIWQAACALADAGHATDAVALAAKLGPNLVRVGGAPYLHQCMGSVPTAANGPYHAEILRQKSYARLMVTIGTRLTQMGRTEVEPDLKAAARAELQALIEADTRGWADPVPLRTVRAVPPFPLASLPTWTRAKAAAVAHETQTPVDLAGTLALAALATAAAGAVRVNVRPETGWSEPANLYLVCALPPGSRKSPVFNSMTAPILATEKHLQEVMGPRIIELAVDRKAADEYASRMADQLAKASPQERDGARHEAHAAALAAQAIVVPHEPRLFTDDITAEQASTLLADHGGHFAVLSAESEIFNEMAGRYSGNPNMNVFLKGHAGDAIRVDRKGRPAEAIDAPALTLGVCTQPAALAALAAIPGAAGRGLLARFLFSIPQVNIGRRETKPAPADPAAHTVYEANLTSLILSLRDLDQPIRLELSPGASFLLDAVAEDTENAMDEGGPLAHMRDWGAKAVGAMMRIAALLHLAEHLRDGYERPISQDTISAAHALIEYYTAHTLAAFDTMTTDETAGRAHQLLDWTAKTGTTRFSARDAFTGLSRAQFPKMNDLDPALNLLEQHGYLRRLPPPPNPGRGRPPAPLYEVHPGIDP
jgi:replicative DNA helicase